MKVNISWLPMPLLALSALAMPASPQTAATVVPQMVDNPGHAYDINQVFPHAGGFFPDGLVRVVVIHRSEGTGPNLREWFAFHAVVVNYGAFTRTGDEWDFKYSNLTAGTGGHKPFKYQSASGWVDDKVKFQTPTRGIQTDLTAAEMQLYADQTVLDDVYVVLNTETNLDNVRLVNLIADPLDASGSPLSQNPFPSDAEGTPSASGALDYTTYRFRMLTGQVEREGGTGNGRNLLGFRPGYIVVSMTENPTEHKRYPGQVVKAVFTGPMVPLTIDTSDPLYNLTGSNYRTGNSGIEASTTQDGNAVFWFGTLENNGSVNSIMFSIRKPQTSGPDLWTAPRNLCRFETEFGGLTFGQAGTPLAGYSSSPLNGVLFREKYPLAAKPLAHHSGVPFNVSVVEYGKVTGERVLGDYPWVFPDGEMITFQTTRGLDLIEGPGTIWTCANWLDLFGARRGSMIVAGESTETNGYYPFRINDSPSNQYLFLKMKTNSTSSGRNNDAWAPNNHLPATQRVFTGIRKDLEMLSLYTVPSQQHRTNDFHGQMTSEVSFRDREDGEYLFYSSLHPLPRLEDFDDSCGFPDSGPKDYVIDWNSAQDSSGNGNPVSLQGDALFPWDYYLSYGTGVNDLLRDSNVGKIGQGVLFKPNGKIVVSAAGNSTVYDFDKELTVDFFVKAQAVPSSGVARLVDSSSFRVELGSDRKLRVTLYTGTGTPVTQTTGAIGTALTLDTWYHVAATFQVGVGTATVTKVYVDGAIIHTMNGTGTVFYRGGAAGPKDLVFGPVGAGTPCTLVMDEIALSRVARTATELEAISIRNTTPPTDVAYGRTNPPLPEGITDHDLFIPSGSAYNANKVSLGKHLFFDTNLSKYQSRSCASCHDPAKGYSDGLPVALDADNQPMGVRTPDVAGAAVSAAGRSFRWSGSVATLEEQTLLPFTGPEMKLPDFAALRTKINLRWATYQGLFIAAFPSDTFNSVNDVQPSHVQGGLAAFVRNLIAGNSRFDRFLTGDNSPNGLTSQQRDGWGLFSGKARCIACHTTAGFTDNEFYNTRVDTGLIGADLLRYNVSKRTRDMGAAKTPSLRNVGRQTFFTHKGTQGQTLMSIVQDYNAGGPTGADVHHKVDPLGLTLAEKNALVDFIQNGLLSDTGTNESDPYWHRTPWP